MTSELLYLSQADIERLTLSPREAREVVLTTLRDLAAGRNFSLPKSIIDLGPGHYFQTMSAASETLGLATVKWIGVAPIAGKADSYAISGLICASDYRTGDIVAVLDGNLITRIRTAALSAVAALYLALESPTCIGFVGCGSQALRHLDAFVDLFPALHRIYLLSRTAASAERVACAASRKGLEPIITRDPDTLLSHSDIVISMASRSPDSRPFLDARLLQPSAFVSAVDAGWTWHPETLTVFDRRITDSLQQTTAPIDWAGRPVEAARFHDEIAYVVGRAARTRGPMRTLFCFRGIAIADLAVTELVINKARAAYLGTVLAR